MTIRQENIQNLMQVLHLQSNEEPYILQNSPQMLLQSLVYDDCTNEDLYELYLSDSGSNSSPLPLSTAKKPKQLQLSQIIKLKQEVLPHSASSFHFPSPPAYSPQIEPLIPPRRSSKVDNDIRYGTMQKPAKNENRFQSTSFIEKRLASEHQIQRKAVSELSQKAIGKMDSIPEETFSKRTAASLIEKRPKTKFPDRNASSMIDKQSTSVLAMVELMGKEESKKKDSDLDPFPQSKRLQTHSQTKSQTHSQTKSQTNRQTRLQSAPHSKNQPLSHKFIPLYQSPSKQTPEYSAFLQNISKRKSSLTPPNRPKLSITTNVRPLNLIHVSDKNDLLLTISQ